MKSHLDVKVTLSVGISIFISLLVVSDALTIKALLSLIGKAVSLTVLVRFLFTKWIWKWSRLNFLQSIHNVPYLEGDWEGAINSTGNERTPVERRKVAVKVKICQPDIFSIKVLRNSDESSSTSHSESIQKTEDGRFVLSYSYLSEPDATVRDRSQISYGSARLVLQENGSLNGNYWTDQKTTGTISLKRIQS